MDALRQAEAAEFFGDGQAEDAELGHLGDDLHRDERRPTGASHGRGGRPARGRSGGTARGSSPARRRAPAGRGDRVCAPLAHQRDEAQARGLAVAAGNELGHRGLFQRTTIGVIEAKVGKPDEFVLAHGDAAGDLRQIFAEADLQDQRFDSRRTCPRRSGGRPRLSTVAGSPHRWRARRARGRPSDAARWPPTSLCRRSPAWREHGRGHFQQRRGGGNGAEARSRASGRARLPVRSRPVRHAPSGHSFCRLRPAIMPSQLQRNNIAPDRAAWINVSRGFR